jgi:transposase
MATSKQSKNPSTRRYSPAEREQAVRLVRQLRKELGTDQGTVGRVNLPPLTGHPSSTS